MIGMGLMSGGMRQKKVQLFFIGDSITYGIGTTGYGSTGSDIEGNNSYPQQAERLLDNPNISMYKKGYSGQNCGWYLSGQVNTDMGLFDLVNYDEIICVVFFGANDVASYPYSDVYNNLVTLHGILKEAGAKTLTVPVMNRVDIPSHVQFNIDRLALNELLYANYRSFSDGIVDLANQPDLYPEEAPYNATYFRANDVDGWTGVHPTDAGAALIATEAKKSIINLL